MLKCLDDNATYAFEPLAAQQADIPPERRIKLVCRYPSLGLQRSIKSALREALAAAKTTADASDACIAQLARLVVRVENLPPSAPGCDPLPQDVSALPWLVGDYGDLYRIACDALDAQEPSDAERGKSQSPQHGVPERCGDATDVREVAGA